MRLVKRRGAFRTLQVLQLQAVRCRLAYAIAQGSDPEREQLKSENIEQTADEGLHQRLGVLGWVLSLALRRGHSPAKTGQIASLPGSPAS
jgi:hypothetical protein